jgi:hypothetical protein
MRRWPWVVAAIAVGVLALLVWAPGKPRPFLTAPDLGPERLVAPHEGNDEDPWLLRLHNGTFLLAWTSPRGSTSDLWMSTSADGEAWSTPSRPFFDGDDDFYPSLAQDVTGRVHLAFFRINATNRDADVWYSSSTDARAWDAPSRIAPSPSPDWVPRIALDPGGQPWVAWSSERSGKRNVWLTHDDVAGWTTPRRITIGNTSDDFPALRAHDSGFQIAFVRYDPQRGEWLTNPTTEILLKESTDGANWTNPVPLTHDPGVRYIDALPSWFEAGGRAFLAWTSNRDDPNGELVYAPLADMREAKALTRSVGRADYSPVVAPAGEEGRYLVAWVRVEGGDADIAVRSFRVS